MRGWNGWYHVNGHTYGQWLPGDPRGWREKAHKQHVDGDYKSPPPPGTGQRLHHYSQEQLKHGPVRLEPAQREAAGQAMVEMLVQLDVELLVLSVDAIHYHLLGRFSDRPLRRLVGRAKQHAWHRLRDRWQIGKLWARLCGVKPIRDRAHQLNAFHYILFSQREGRVGVDVPGRHLVAQ